MIAPILSANLSGVLPVDKAPGMTSHDIVATVRRSFRPDKIKVGHAGTLDPDATGLLLVCVGGATRLADLLADRGKVYRAEFVLGAATTTEDASGDVIAERDASLVTRPAVLDALASLTGEIEQVPPMVSAVHHEGARLYDLARRGIEVERAARRITVESIVLDEFTPGSRARGTCTVACGKGVYIRTLCADLGKILAVGGHMSELRRLRVGEFDVEGALPTNEITAESIRERLVPSVEAVSFLPSRSISEPEMVDVLHGRAVAAVGFDDRAGLVEFVRLIGPNGELAALATYDRQAGQLWPKKVLTLLPGAS